MAFCGTTQVSVVSNWATTGRAGWPKQRRNSITGSPLVLPPPRLWNITPMRPAILLNFLNGHPASGNVNSVIGPKMNSCRSHAITNGGLPLSVIVIDFFHWTLQGDWRFDP